MLELIAGIGLGLWIALAVTVVTVLYARKHDLLGDRRDAMLRAEIENAFDKIADIENELAHVQNMQTENGLQTKKKLSEIYSAVERMTRNTSIQDDRGQ